MSTPTRQSDPADEAFDRTLRRIGRRLPLPAAPTAAQRALWKSSPPGAGRSAWLRRIPGAFTAAGGALAAAIVLGAFFVVPARSGDALTAAIFRDLREAPRRGLSILIDDVRIDDLSVTSTVQMVFPRPVTLPQLLDIRDVPAPRRAYVDVALHAGPGQKRLAGLILRAAAAFGESDAWAYLRVDRLPAKLAESAPLMAGATALLHDGLVVDLAGVERLLDGFERLTAPVVATIDPTRAAQRSGLPTHDNRPAPIGDPATIESLLNGMLAGTLSGEQLLLLVGELERIVGDAQVRPRGPGEWVLTGSRFRFDDPSADDARLLARAVLTIVYREGSGVQAVELSHVGAADGTIRVEFLDGIDARLMDRQRLIQRGARSMSFNTLLRILGSPPAGP